MVMLESFASLWAFPSTSLLCSCCLLVYGRQSAEADNLSSVHIVLSYQKCVIHPKQASWMVYDLSDATGCFCQYPSKLRSLTNWETPPPNQIIIPPYHLQLCSRLNNLISKLRKDIIARKDADPGEAVGLVMALENEFSYVWHCSEEQRLAAVLFENDDVVAAHQVSSGIWT